MSVLCDLHAVAHYACNSMYHTWYAYSKHLSTICRYMYLQTFHACSQCSLSSWTSTSVRVSWPTRWYYRRTWYYAVTCASTPTCGHTSVPRGRNTYRTTVSSLIAGTYYMFTVSSVPPRSQKPRVLLHTYCEGTTSLYQSSICSVLAYICKC